MSFRRKYSVRVSTDSGLPDSGLKPDPRVNKRVAGETRVDMEPEL